MSEQNPWGINQPENEAPAQPQIDEFGNPIPPQQPIVPEQPAASQQPVMPEQPAAPQQPVAAPQPQYGAYAPQPQAGGYEQAPAQPQYGAYAPQPADQYGAPTNPAEQPTQTSYGMPLQAAGYGEKPASGPSKTKPIVMIVMGLVMMFVLAPIIFFGGIGIGFAQNFGLTNKTEVVVGNIPNVQVIVNGPSSDTAICGLVGADGIVDLYPRGNGQFDNPNVPAGTYQVACDNVTAADRVIAFSGDEAVQMLLNGTALAGLIISTIVGIIGIILLIVGIVKLVKVNKQRRLQANPYGW
ncbi:hypothetical protein NXS08_04935 [Gleimia sp. 6138-11-ORH1]|uniref:hypothetical protein n=1 Tax=Gleimia sp. 6138-11-ORH1 TaxID=2973937 RepID=UPI0021677318|nr:hypothetical protein [Gleimia sp. 6138-11-ORH1]MCS4484822.1 hypothetical protein [Gleimia sp. 6138-11-ORH1]